MAEQYDSAIIFLMKTKEEEKEYFRKYYLKNKEKLDKLNSEYYLNNKKNISELASVYRKVNKEKIAKEKAEYAEVNKEKILKYKSEYYIKNKELISKKAAAYRIIHKEEISKRDAIRRNKNKEKISKQKAIYREKNRDKILLSKNRYSKANKEKINKYALDKYYSDDIYRFKEQIKNLIRISFKRCGFKKTSRTADILGCEYDEFRLYLESKFESWMNWENKGNWNGTPIEINVAWDIDHIIPLSTAVTEEDVIRLNHYTNLQPLCSYTNRHIKRDRLDYK